jgi:thioredoxin reductase (NADPH)
MTETDLDQSRSAAIVVVGGDLDSIQRLGSTLERRFGLDYQIVTRPSGQAALTSLRELGASGSDVALVLAEQGLPDMTGVDLLAQVAASHRDARRTLLINWGDRSTADWIVKSSALGQMDAYVV